MEQRARTVGDDAATGYANDSRPGPERRSTVLQRTCSQGDPVRAARVERCAGWNNGAPAAAHRAAGPVHLVEHRDDVAASQRPIAQVHHRRRHQAGAVEVDRIAWLARDGQRVVRANVIARQIGRAATESVAAADVDQPRQVRRAGAHRELSSACDAGTRISRVCAAREVEPCSCRHAEAAGVGSSAGQIQRAAQNLHRPGIVEGNGGGDDRRAGVQQLAEGTGVINAVCRRTGGDASGALELENCPRTVGDDRA